MVQDSLYTRLQKTNKNVRDLGVKQAPFMVLVGATMPSILAEISFITHRQEDAAEDGQVQAAERRSVSPP
jgi:N-acetylmuramoyl-L-alanine amidase